MASSRVRGAGWERLWREAQEPLFVLDGKCRLLAVNKAWERCTGYSSETVKKLVCQSGPVEHSVGLEALAAALSPPIEALESGRASKRTLLAGPNQEPLDLIIEFQTYHDKNGSLLYVTGLVQQGGNAQTIDVAESTKLHAELSRIRGELRKRYALDRLIGAGPRHRRLMEQVSAASQGRFPVLVKGEPGVGKRAVARAIHTLSSFAESPIIVLDCQTLQADQIERELFGLGRENPGVGHDFDQAGGVLVLHEAQLLPRDLQAKLVLESDSLLLVRLVATSSTNFETAFREERITSAYYYTFTQFAIEIPPLRDRLDELPLLAQAFLERASASGAKSRRRFFRRGARRLSSLRLAWEPRRTRASRQFAASIGRARTCPSRVASRKHQRRLGRVLQPSQDRLLA